MIDRPFMVFVISSCSSQNFRPVFVQRIGNQLAVVHVVDFLCFTSFDSTGDSSGSWLCLSAWSCMSDPLIFAVVFCAYRLCISRHASAPAPWSCSRRRRHFQWPTLLRLFQKADSFPQRLRLLSFPLPVFLLLGTHRVERTCCDCWSLTQAPSLLSVYQDWLSWSTSPASSLNLGHWSNCLLTLRIQSSLSPCSRNDSENVSNCCCSQVSSATASFVEAPSSNLCQVFWATLTPGISCARSMSLKIGCPQTVSVRLKKSLLANTHHLHPPDQQCLAKSFALVVLVCVSTWSVILLMLSCLGLGGSRRNVSLYCNRLTSNFVSVLNLRYLDVLVPRVGHFSDGSVSVTRVWTRIHHVIHMTQKDGIVFWYKEEVPIGIVFEQRRLVQAYQVLEQLCIIHNIIIPTR